MSFFSWVKRKNPPKREVHISFEMPSRPYGEAWFLYPADILDLVFTDVATHAKTKLRWEVTRELSAMPGDRVDIRAVILATEVTFKRKVAPPDA